MSYSELIEKGSALLNRGAVQEAHDVFSDISRTYTTAECQELLGICLRLLRRFNEAAEALQDAYELAEGDVEHQGRILRNWGMVFLDQGDHHRAVAYFQQSMWLVTDPIEQAVSKGFFGRATAGTEGKRLMREADTVLRGRAPYELNNLIWLMKSESPLARWRLAPRALKLARDARHKARLVEIIALTTGGSRLHDALKRLR